MDYQYFVQLHCGATYYFTYTNPIDCIEWLANKFMKAHRELFDFCKKGAIALDLLQSHSTNKENFIVKLIEAYNALVDMDGDQIKRFNTVQCILYFGNDEVLVNEAKEN